MSRFVIASADVLKVQAGHGVASPYAMTLVSGAGALDLAYEEVKRIVIDALVLVLEEPDILVCMEAYRDALEQKQQEKETKDAKKQAKTRATGNIRKRGRVRTHRAGAS